MKLKDKPKGTMTVLDHDDPRVIEFNGIPAERAAVSEHFEELMKTGHYLAFVKTPGAERGTQIRSGEFPVEEPNFDVTLIPQFQGG